jgi:hypothetical protein
VNKKDMFRLNASREIGGIESSRVRTAQLNSIIKTSPIIWDVVQVCIVQPQILALPQNLSLRSEENRRDNDK